MHSPGPATPGGNRSTRSASSDGSRHQETSPKIRLTHWRTTTSRHSLLSPPPTSWPQPREATPGEPSSDQPAVHLSSAVQTTAPEYQASLPTASASDTLPQVRPSSPPGLPTRPLWAPSLSPGAPQAVPISGYQQVSFTASQPLAQVPASIHGKVQHSEYIYLSELLVCNFQYKYSRLDDSQALEIVDSKLLLAAKCKSRHLSTLQLWLKAWHIYEDTVLIFFPAGTRSYHTICATLQTSTNASTGQQCSAMMCNFIINAPCRGSPSVPLTSSCT